MSSNTSQTKKRRRIVPRDIITHILCYIFVNALLIFLNFVTNFPPDYLWFVWPLTGWGLGLIFHIAIRGIARKKWRTGTKFLMIHLVIYLVMTLYFFYLDTFTGLDFKNPINWSYFPISAWGTMLFSHFLSMLFIQVREKPEEHRAKKRHNLFNAFIVHLFIFLCANAYMLIVNFLTGFETKWFLYALGGTLLALAIHLIVTILEVIPIRNTQLKILLYHLFIFIVVCAYIIFDDWLSTGGQYWYWPVGGWSLGILLHLIYCYIVQVVRKKKVN